MFKQDLFNKVSRLWYYKVRDVYTLAEIVKTTFVISHFLDKQKETTLFPIIPKRIGMKGGMFLVISIVK